MHGLSFGIILSCSVSWVGVVIHKVISNSKLSALLCVDYCKVFACTCCIGRFEVYCTVLFLNWYVYVGHFYPVVFI